MNFPEFDYRAILEDVLESHPTVAQLNTPSDEPIVIKKMGFTMPVSWESLAPDKRKGSVKIGEIPVTDEEKKAYRKAKRHYKALQKSPYWWDGYEGGELTPPRPKIIYRAPNGEEWTSR